MKLLLVSDLHYTLKQLDWVCAVAGSFDLVVIAGDHLDISSTLGADAQIVVILKYLRRIRERAPVIVCSGNHDLNGRDAAGERTARWMARVRELGIPTDEDFLQLDGLAITICPWWDGPASRDAVGAQLARDATRRGARWLWVYHAPPMDAAVSWVGQRSIGDEDLLDWIRAYRPDLVLSGHIHQSPFRSGGSWVDRIDGTWVFNAGRQIGPVPTHVVIDLAAGTGYWSSLAGEQTIRLDDPAAKPLEVSPP